MLDLWKKASDLCDKYLQLGRLPAWESIGGVGETVIFIAVISEKDVYVIDCIISFIHKETSLLLFY